MQSSPMIYQSMMPFPELRPWVECLWTLSGASPPAGAPETIVPDGCMELIVHLGDRFSAVVNGATELQPRAFLVGQMNRYLTLVPPAAVETLGVRFRPAGAHSFFPLPMSDLVGDIFPIEALWGGRAESFLDALQTAKSRADRLRIVQETLVARIDPRVDVSLQPLIEWILRRRGRVEVGSLPDLTGGSGRTLERRFLRQVGLSPKTFCRIIRVQGIFEMLRSEAPRWAEIAAECRYFDQSHLIREFRQLTGESPTRFLQRQGELSRHFTAPDRLADLMESGK